MTPRNFSHSPPGSRSRGFAAAFGSGDFQRARQLALELTRRDPDNARAWQWLGAAALCLGRHGEALTSLTRSHQLDGSAVQTLYLIAKTHYRDARWNEARCWLERTLRHAPRHVNAKALLARVHLENNEEERAETLLDQALALAPQRPTLLYQRLRVRLALGRLNGILEDCRTLLRLAPNNLDYLRQAATLHAIFGLFDDARRLNRRALELRPGDPAIASSQFLLDHYNPDLCARDLSRRVEHWRNAFSVRRGQGRPLRRPEQPDRKLTLGLLSAGAGLSPTARAISAALECLPADHFRLIAYSSKGLDAPIERRLLRSCDAWRRTDGVSNDRLETLIREDRVDILIDLAGHSEGNRLTLLANEPAPLIVKWLGGLVNSTGLTAIDYLIGDGVVTPPGCDGQYLEKLIRLPHDHLCYEPPGDAPKVGPLPARANGFVTFGCLSNPAKLNHKVIAQWARLINEVEGSRLLLQGGQFDDAGFRERIETAFADHGIGADRLSLKGADRQVAVLNTYNHIDIALDPWPYSGGLAACEAMLMGVPVITLPGPAFAGRQAATHLVNAGLPELVVSDWREYRRRARELAGDLDSLAVIRERLRDTLLASPLCDTSAFARSLDTALRGIWQRHCEDLPPAALTFASVDRARFDDGLAPPPPASPPTRTLAQAGEKERGLEEDFEFDLDDRLVVLDNGARLLNDNALALHRLGAFHLLFFDPEGRGLDDDLRDQDDVQYFPGAVLGDGGPTILHVCLDPSLTGTLVPRADSGVGARVLAELSIRSVALKRIEGLPSLDWLVLDERHDSLRVLDHSGDALDDTLIIQAGVRFDHSHQGQPDLGALCAWADANGFQLYRLHDLEYQSHLPCHLGTDRPATDLQRADALLLPNPERLTALSAARKQRLAFLLHTAYGIRDLTHRLLHESDPVAATHYLLAAGLSPPGAPIDAPTVFVVGCGHSGTNLMAAMLGAHGSIHRIPRQTRWFLDNPRLEQEYPRDLAEARRHGKKVLCESTPRHLHCIEDIARRFPQARFIAMVRNGHDVVSSLKKQTGSFEDGARRWRDDSRVLMSQQQRGTLYLVRYEDLIEDPEGTLQGTLDFLGEPYDPAVLEARARAPGGKAPPPLSEKELTLLRETCGDLMTQFGYAPGAPGPGRDPKDRRSTADTWMQDMLNIAKAPP